MLCVQLIRRLQVPNSVGNQKQYSFGDFLLKKAQNKNIISVHPPVLDCHLASYQSIETYGQYPLLRVIRLR
jgi:hypothetical protein